MGNTAPEALSLNASLASRNENEDPIDLAIIAGLKPDRSLKDYNIIHFQPFDPVDKRTEATVENINGERFKITEGATQVILALSSNADRARSQYYRTRFCYLSLIIKLYHDRNNQSDFSSIRSGFK